MTSPAAVTVEKVTGIEHNDPDVAGFVDGWHWQVDTHLGRFESYAPTEDAAREAAAAVAASHGHPVE